METITIDKNELKKIIQDTVKETLNEIISDKKNILEILEDYAFGKLMEESDNDEFVPEKKIMDVLKK